MTVAPNRRGPRFWGVMAATLVCILCALVLLKPQEFVPAFEGVPILHIMFAASLLAGVVDVVMGKIRLSVAPHVPFVLAFFFWCALVTFARSPRTFSSEIGSLGIVLCLFGATAFLPGTLQGVRNVGVAYLSSVLFASIVAIQQADGPLGCMQADENDWEGRYAVVFDGRTCETTLDCRKDPPDPRANYRCERLGPFGTSTIGGRVRYRGTLADPNDLSLAAALALPFAVALSENPRPTKNAKPSEKTGTFARLLRLGLGLSAIALIGTMIVLSQSRMGVLVFLIVMGLALLRRAGAWGAVLALILLPPVLVLGGRDGADADASSKERVDLIADALTMIRSSHGIGVGVGRFAAESSNGLTAHNSYLLATSETGLVGMILFSLMLYTGVKIPICCWLLLDELDARMKQWASAIAIALSGCYVGIFLLSWAYKEVVYLLLGLSAAYHQAVVQVYPHLRFTLSFREIVIVVVFATGFVPVIYGLVRIFG